MNFHQRPAPSVVTTDFELLRGRLESGVTRPAVFAITSSTRDDGREVAARALAVAFAAAGYRTVFVDTAPVPNALAKSGGTDFEELARSASASRAAGNFSVLTLNDEALQKRTSQRNVRTAFETLRASFDYVFICTESGSLSSFGQAVLKQADGVLATIKAGRRIKSADVQLGSDLKALGTAFLGVVQLDPSVTNSDPSMLTAPVASTEPRRSASVTAGAGA